MICLKRIICTIIGHGFQPIFGKGQGTYYSYFRCERCQKEERRFRKGLG